MDTRNRYNLSIKYQFKKGDYMASQQPKIIIIGAGFGGLFAARELADEPIEVLLVDRNNFHTFTPLLYQVATCALDPSEIAYPVRSIFRDEPNVHFLLGNVTGIDHDTQQITVSSNNRDRVEAFDYLIVAGGSTPTYFGNDDFREHAFEMRTLRDSVQLRNHILRLFERALWTEDVERRAALTRIVVVGGGPTGLETAGAIYELYNHVLHKEYTRYGAELQAEVLLIEKSPYLLAPYPDKLRTAALKQLESLGVQVVLGKAVQKVHEDHIVLDDGTQIPTFTFVWSAGVRASPLADMLAVDLTPRFTIPILPTTQVIGRDNIYAVGDNAHLPDDNGEPYAMIIPVAQQQGTLAAKNILRRIKGKVQQDFDYYDRGIMATIGRRRAVVWAFKRFKLTGFVAWMAWLGLHLVTLMGFRNRLNVLVNWGWNYLTYDRSVRIILEPPVIEEEF